MFVFTSGWDADFKAFAAGKVDPLGRANDGLGKIKAQLIGDVRAFDLLRFAFAAKTTKSAATATTPTAFAENFVKDIFGVRAGKAEWVILTKSTARTRLTTAATATKRPGFATIGINQTIVEFLATFGIAKQVIGA